MSNIGQAASLDNGRGIDTRGNNVEEIYIENSTFYNLTSRLIRDGGGFIKHLTFNHNTVMNVAQHMMTPGEVQNASITNNLFVNPGFLGFYVYRVRAVTATETLVRSGRMVLLK